jgi:hypothetical protein
MDLVYSCAEATIIVAAGTDPTYRIPGVGSRFCRSRPSATVGKYLLFSTLPDPLVPILASRWATRGWTYQEIILSPRRLIFTDDQVHFECCRMSCQETVSTFPTWPRIYGATLWGGRFSLPRDFKDVGLVKRQIAHHSKLQLTNESDRLRTILGIFRSCEKMATPIYH